LNFCNDPNFFWTGLTGFNRIANFPASQVSKIVHNPVNPVRRTQFIRTLLSSWFQFPNQKTIRENPRQS